MVDITQATESTFLTKDLVEKSKSKIVVILNSGDYEETNFGKKYSVKVSIDAKEKKWNPNVPTCMNMFEAWGANTDNYIGKKLSLQIIKNCIIGTPIKETEEKIQG